MRQTRNLGLLFVLCLSFFALHSNAKNIKPGSKTWVLDQKPILNLDNPESLPDVLYFSGVTVSVPSTITIDPGQQHEVTIDADGNPQDGGQAPISSWSKPETWWEVSGSNGDYFSDVGGSAVFSPSAPGVYTVDFHSKSMFEMNSPSDEEDLEFASDSEVPCTVLVTTCQYGDWVGKNPPSIAVNKPNNTPPVFVNTQISVQTAYAITPGVRVKHSTNGCADQLAPWYVSKTKPTITGQAVGDNGEVLPLTTSILASDFNGGTVKGVFKPTKPGKYSVTFKVETQTVDPGETTVTSPPSPAVEISVCTISTETVETLPSDRTRKTLGIGESVKFLITPSITEPVTWNLKSGGGTLTALGSTATFTAPEISSSSVITATLSGTTKSTTIKTIEPNGLLFEKHNITQAKVNPFLLQYTVLIYVLPDSVNFSKITISEDTVGSPQTAIATGYFVDQNGTPHTHGDILGMDQFIAGKGTRAFGADIVTGNTKDSNYKAGTFFWNLPWYYQLGGTVKQIGSPVQHWKILTIKSDGKARFTLRKGQSSASLDEP